MTMRRDSGFTLMELLVVLAIIGVLASIVLASLQSARDKAQNTYTVISIKQVINALEIIYSERGDYPASTDLVQPTSIVSLSSDTPNGCLAMIQLLYDSNVVKQEFSMGLSNFPKVKPVEMNILGTDYNICPSYRCATYDMVTGICSRVILSYPIKGNGTACLQGFVRYAFGSGGYECSGYLEGF